jgi:tripartite-type tricarboxylate transporter receptor subunit TctC
MTHSPSSISRRTLLGGLATVAATPWVAQAQSGSKFPTKAVTLVVPYSAGGGTDIVGRLIAQQLQELWGQSVVVDNRTGANGAIGSNLVAKAAPDGHTLLLVVGSHAINPVLMKSLPYDTAKAFTPITNIATSPMVLVVSAKGPYKTLDDVIAAAQKEELPIGYSEGQTRLTGELIRQAGNLKMVGVPYKGGAPLMVDVIGGHLPLGVTSVLTALPHVQAGNLRVVAVAGEQRLAVFPEAKIFAEVGLKGVESLSWYGMFGPAGMPDALVLSILSDLKKVTAGPVVVKQMQDQGAKLVLNSPGEFKSFLAGETAKWTRVARNGGITAE